MFLAFKSFFILVSMSLFLSFNVRAEVLSILIPGSINQTGVMQQIANQFEREHPQVHVSFRYVSSLKLFDEARKGAYDIVVSHYPKGEAEFIDEGYGALQAHFMYNKFAIFGPKEDEYQLSSKKTLKEVLATLHENKVEFLAPSDFSGTKKHLDQIWTTSGMTPDWFGYEVTKLSGASTLDYANSAEAFTYVDMGTYIVNKAITDNITPLFRDDVQLNNYYSIIVLDQTKVQRHNQSTAEAFFRFIVSPKIQKYIQEFGTKTYGMDLYIPYAMFDETVISMNNSEQSEQERNYLLLFLFASILIVSLLVWVMQQRKLRKGSEYLAQIDDLTQVGNRRALNIALEEAVKGEKPFAAMLIDLCGFKPINDTYGHDCGDEVLKAIAEALKKTLHADGQVYRLGGDEFVLIVENTSKVNERRMNQIVRAVRTKVGCNQSKISVSPSIGISYFPQDAKDVTSLMHQADKAMYVAKNTQQDYCEYV